MNESNLSPVQIDLFRPTDAPGIAQLFRTVYGESYPVQTFYRPDELIEANAQSRIISMVARADANEIAGHVAFVHSAPYAKSFELASGLVLPAYRKLGLFNQLFDFSYQVAQKNADIEQVSGDPVCNHVASQKNVLRINHVEYALEVDLMPAQVYAQEQSVQGRVSTLLTICTIQPKPQTVYLPHVYRTELEFLYADFGNTRTFLLSESDLPKANLTQTKMDIFDTAQVARITIYSLGADFANVVTQLEDKARAKNVVVFQMWLPLASPSIDAAIDILRARGYFFGGLLPRWFDNDGLFMQKVMQKPNWEGITLYTERAKKITEWVKQDWKKTQVSN